MCGPGTWILAAYLGDNVVGEKSTTATLLNDHRSWLHSKYVSWHSQESVALTFQQKLFSVQQSDTMTEKYSEC